MDEKSNDVKTAAASSASANVDANKGAAETSTQQTAASSKSGQESGASLRDVLSQKFGAEPEGTEEEQTAATAATDEKAESDVQDLNKTEAEEQAEGDEPEAQAEEQKEDATSETEEAKGPIPYERFHEVIEQKNTLEARVKEQEPIVEAYNSIQRYCEENAISADDFQTSLKIVAAINSGDIAEARKLLQPIADTLLSLDGKSELPQDLRDEIEAGTLTEERAREISQLRNQRKFAEERGKMTAQRAQAQRQQQFVATVQQTLVSWETKKLESDPDFKPKANGEADGKYEWFLDKMRGLLATAQVRTPQDAVKLAEQAYASVASGMSRFIPKQTGTKTIPSSKSSTTSTRAEPKTVREAAMEAARRHGIEF